ncbi:MAG: PDZ domain-containing protein [Phycisphaerae bacterium]|nr:PDZ domain-containing protein [Phycisphaerae bacterium]
MKRTGIIVAAIAATLTGSIQAKTPEDIYKEFSGAMGIVELSVDTGDGLQSAAGPAICVHSDKQGRAVFLTTAFSIQTQIRTIRKLTVKPGGLDAKTVPAEAMGVDPVTGLAFVRTAAAAKWTKVVFVGKRSGLKIGQQIVSIGLQDSSTGFEPYLGVAYVSGRVRVPETLYRVTGGNLTGTCSPVFNLDGKVVGIVARQLPTSVQMMTPRGQTYVSLIGRDEKNYFLPIDEFANTISSMPSPTNPKRRIWTGVVAYVPVTDDDAKTYGVNVPAVMVGKVVKGGPADKAGLKERDLIIGLGGRTLEKFPTPSLVGKRFLNNLQSIASSGSKQVSLSVKRGDKQFSATVGLAAVPKQPFEAERYVSKELALAVREKVPPDSYTDSGPTAGVKGLIVLAAPDKGSAGAAGVRRGDLLIQVNGESVTTAAGMRSAIDKAVKNSPGKAIVLLVQRGDKTYPISIIRSRK